MTAEANGAAAPTAPDGGPFDRALCAAAGSLCPALQSAAGNGASFIAAESRPCSHSLTCRQYTAHSVPAPSVPSAQRISNTAFRTSSCRARCKSPLSCGVSSTGWVVEKEGVRAEPASVVWVVTTGAMAVVVWEVVRAVEETAAVGSVEDSEEESVEDLEEETVVDSVVEASVARHFELL